MNRRLSVLILGSILGLGAFVAPAPAYQTKKEVVKEPTDGFFDVPPRDPSEDTPPWGLPAYMLTSAIGGLAIFIACKSARRS